MLASVRAPQHVAALEQVWQRGLGFSGAWPFRELLLGTKLLRAQQCPAPIGFPSVPWGRCTMGGHLGGTSDMLPSTSQEALSAAESPWRGSTPCMAPSPPLGWLCSDFQGVVFLTGDFSQHPAGRVPSKFHCYNILATCLSYSLSYSRALSARSGCPLGVPCRRGSLS